jgi:hypothetical protein
MFEEDLGSICHCDALFVGCENDHLRKPKNHQKYIIISFLGGWKASHVIHRYGFPRALGSRKRGA